MYRLVPEQLIAEPLSHTADDADYQIRAGFLDVLEMPQVRKCPLLGMFSHRTRVYQNDVSFLNAIGKTESGLFERRSYKGRIELVHLTAKGL